MHLERYVHSIPGGVSVLDGNQFITMEADKLLPVVKDLVVGIYSFAVS